MVRPAELAENGRRFSGMISWDSRKAENWSNELLSLREGLKTDLEDTTFCLRLVERHDAKHGLSKTENGLDHGEDRDELPVLCDVIGCYMRAEPTCTSR